MASCDRGDTQFPELSGGGSGSRTLSELLAVAAAPAPISQPFLAGAPAPARRCRPGGTRGGGRRGRFQRRKWLLHARERLICNWGRADWCSWRRRGGRSGGGGGGGWPLSNGEGGGGDAAAEGAGLGCATRRCHHCTGANSGGGAGSYFPLLPRCCFCRLGRRRRREREGGGSVAARSCGLAHTPAGRGSRAVRSPVRGGGPVLPSSGFPPPFLGSSVFSQPTRTLPPPTRVPHPRVLRPGCSLPCRTPPPRLPHPGFPLPGARGRP